MADLLAARRAALSPPRFGGSLSRVREAIEALDRSGTRIDALLQHYVGAHDDETARPALKLRRALRSGRMRWIQDFATSPSTPLVLAAVAHEISTAHDAYDETLGTIDTALLKALDDDARHLVDLLNDSPVLQFSLATTAPDYFRELRRRPMRLPAAGEKPDKKLSALYNYAMRASRKTSPISLLMVTEALSEDPAVERGDKILHRFEPPIQHTLEWLATNLAIRNAGMLLDQHPDTVTLRPNRTTTDAGDQVLYLHPAGYSLRTHALDDATRDCLEGCAALPAEPWARQQAHVRPEEAASLLEAGLLEIAAVPGRERDVVRAVLGPRESREVFLPIDEAASAEGIDLSLPARAPGAEHAPPGSRTSSSEVRPVIDPDDTGPGGHHYAFGLSGVDPADLHVLRDTAEQVRRVVGASREYWPGRHLGRVLNRTGLAERIIGRPLLAGWHEVLTEARRQGGRPGENPLRDALGPGPHTAPWLPNDVLRSLGPREIPTISRTHDEIRLDVDRLPGGHETGTETGTATGDEPGPPGVEAYVQVDRPSGSVVINSLYAGHGRLAARHRHRTGRPLQPVPLDITAAGVARGGAGGTSGGGQPAGTVIAELNSRYLASVVGHDQLAEYLVGTPGADAFPERPGTAIALRDLSIRRGASGRLELYRLSTARTVRVVPGSAIHVMHLPAIERFMLLVSDTVPAPRPWIGDLVGRYFRPQDADSVRVPQVTAGGVVVERRGVVVNGAVVPRRERTERWAAYAARMIRFLRRHDIPAQSFVRMIPRDATGTWRAGKSKPQYWDLDVPLSLVVFERWLRGVDDDLLFQAALPADGTNPALEYVVQL